MDVQYPSEEQVVAYNKILIMFIQVKKADRAEVLSPRKLKEVLEKCKQTEGNIYEKAAVLMQELIRKHVFASGNRRTAFLMTKDFVLMNNGVFAIPNDSKYARVFIGIRENFYRQSEISKWIQHGKIRPFKR